MGRPKGSKNGSITKFTCLTCNKTEHTHRKSKKYCSHKCYAISKRKVIPKNLPCKVCGKPVNQLRHKPNGKRDVRVKTVCSFKCRSTVGGLSGAGRITPEHVRKKIGDAQRGCKANNWKGGIWLSQPQYERKSARYRTIRREVMERDLYKCVLCGSGGELEVDHIKSYSKHPDLRFDKANLRTLCKPCHKLTPTYCKG